MPTCCVKSCKNRGSIPGITYHKIPFRMKEEWHRILNVHGMKHFSIHNAVCSDHFRPGDLDRDGFRVVLKKGAIPLLYLDRPKTQTSNKGRKIAPVLKVPVVPSNFVMISKDRHVEAPQPKRRKSQYKNDESKRPPCDKAGNLSWFSTNDVKIIDIGTILAKEETS